LVTTDSLLVVEAVVAPARWWEARVLAVLAVAGTVVTLRDRPEPLTPVAVAVEQAEVADLPAEAQEL
jgi:hypothetical protein